MLWKNGLIRKHKGKYLLLEKITTTITEIDKRIEFEVE